jgi:hypothetical protein
MLDEVSQKAETKTELTFEAFIGATTCEREQGRNRRKLGEPSDSNMKERGKEGGWEGRSSKEISTTHMGSQGCLHGSPPPEWAWPVA